MEAPKNLGYNSKTKSKAKIVLNVDGTLESDTHSVGNHINNFFTNVAVDLTSKLPEAENNYGIGSDHFDEFYRSKGVTDCSFELGIFDEEFIFKELSTLNINKAVGLDDIGTRFLKDGARQLSPIITHIVNLSIRSATVPQGLKLAKVIPLYKKGSRLEVGNYRPVSLLKVVVPIINIFFQTGGDFYII